MDSRLTRTPSRSRSNRAKRAQDQRLRRKPKSLGDLVVTQVTSKETHVNPKRKGRPCFLPANPATLSAWNRLSQRSMVRELL